MRAVPGGFRSWAEHEAYMSGPPSIVRARVDTLRRHGLAPEWVHYDPLIA